MYYASAILWSRETLASNAMAVKTGELCRGSTGGGIQTVENWIFPKENLQHCAASLRH
jgi:hypothetical protein